MEIDVLAVLDEMDAFRRKHYYDNPSTPDFYMRVLEAMLARAAGYNSRTDWTDELKRNRNTRYTRDYADPEKWGTF